MITGHIDNTDLQYYPPAVRYALSYLAKQDLPALPSGVHTDEQTGWQVQVQDLQTKQEQENYPEAHRRYIDLHFLVTGYETIYVKTQPVDLEIHEPYDAVRDIIFYKPVADETRIRMLPGTFAVLFTQDLHRPNCATTVPEAIRKIVIKIPLTDLMKP